MSTTDCVAPGEGTPWSELPVEKRLEHLRGMVVERDIERRIHECFDNVRAARLSANEPSNVLVIGETGVGKSDILKRYLAKNAPARLRNGNLHRPVFHVEIRNSSTPRSAAKHMLKMLGLTKSSFLTGSTPELTERVKHQMILQGVELCTLDEFNNTLSDDGRVRSSKVAEWVKDLCKSKTRTAGQPDGLPGEIIPFAMVGTDKTGRIVDPIENPELSSLTPYRFDIPRYRYSTVEEVTCFRAFLDGLDQELPFDQFSDIGQVDEQGLCPLADKIHVATHGLLRQVGYLIREAARLAIMEQADRITEHHLHRSVENQRGLLQSSLLSAEMGQKQTKVKRVVTNPFAAPPAPATKSRPAVKSGYQQAA